MKTFGYFNLLIMMVLTMLTLSCSEKNDAETRIEAAKLVESRSSKDLMSDLYLASDGDVESLARILQITPSSIERIRNGKTEPTAQFEEKIKSVSIYYYQNGRKFSKLLSALDDEYGWYDYILDIPFHYTAFFLIVNAIFLIAWLLISMEAVRFFVIEILIFVVAFIASLFMGPSTMEDKYTDAINPVIEQLL